MGMVKKGKFIYVAYDREDGLPIAVADTVKELAEMIGKSRTHISQALCKHSQYYGKVKNDEQ